MSLTNTLRPLEEVLSWLPFEVDDFAAVNNSYARWCETRSEKELDVVLKWMYGYTYRYVMVRYVRNDAMSSIDVDILHSAMFLQAYGSMNKINDPSKFASYTSVLCRNVYSNHVRKLIHQQELEFQEASVSQTEATQFSESSFRDDNQVLRQELEQAIRRLPEVLQQIVRQRFLEGVPYKKIALQTGYTPATLRSFVHKALRKLYHDPRLAGVIREWNGM